MTAYTAHFCHREVGRFVYQVLSLSWQSQIKDKHQYKKHRAPMQQSSVCAAQNKQAKRIR